MEAVSALGMNLLPNGLTLVDAPSSSRIAAADSAIFAALSAAIWASVARSLCAAFTCFTTAATWALIRACLRSSAAAANAACISAAAFSAATRASVARSNAAASALALSLLPIALALVAAPSFSCIAAFDSAICAAFVAAAAFSTARGTSAMRTVTMMEPAFSFTIRSRRGSMPPTRFPAAS